MPQDNLPTTPAPAKTPAYLDHLSDLLDSRFRIPGTDIRFGLDFLIGIIPGIGDVASLGISGLLVVAMVQNGASGKVTAKMLGNILLDAVVGAIPILGDIFDLQYKANRRNLALLQEHLKEGKHTGSAWPYVIAAVVVLVGLIALAIWLIVKLFQLIF